MTRTPIEPEEAEAIAAAHQSRHELNQDGAAPPVEEVLRYTRRDEDVGDHSDADRESCVLASAAARKALGLYD